MIITKTVLPVLAAIEIGGLVLVQSVVTAANGVPVSFSAFSTIVTVLVSVIVSYTVLRVTVSFIEKDVATIHHGLDSVRNDVASLGREVSELRGRATGRA